MKTFARLGARLYHRWLVWRLEGAARRLDRYKGEFGDCGWHLAVHLSRTISAELRRVERRKRAMAEWDAAHPQSP